MSKLTDALKVDLDIVLSYEGDTHEIEAFHVLKDAARLVADASVLAGGGGQWIMDWEGELIHPTDLPDGRYLVIPIAPPEGI